MLTVRGASIESVAAAAYTIPTDAPEGDGTLSWDSTTLVLVEVAAGGETGLGYTYAYGSIVPLIEGKLADELRHRDAMQIPAAWTAMQRVVRNLGRAGLVATAVSAVDTALWDLKARLLGLPLAMLLGSARDRVPIYGSGGFTTYGDDRLCEQMSAWVQKDGCRWVKMKIGAEPEKDDHRVQTAKASIGAAALMVDANRAFTRKQALKFAETLALEDVVWLEEPVSSDDLDGMHHLRARAPAGMEIAAGDTATPPTISERC